MKVFEKNSTLGIVYSQSLSINENGDIGASWFNHTQSLDSDLWCNDFYMNGFDFSKKYMLFQNSIPNASAVVFKRLLCVKSGLINTSYKINGDWDLYTRILASSDIGFISQDLNFFRQHNKKGSTVNVKNGNNIHEHYKLLTNWKIIFKLESSLYSKISQHIFDNWNEQHQKSIIKVMQNNFFKIFKSAIYADKFIFERFFRAYL
jgi:transposase-like protein